MIVDNLKAIDDRDWLPIEVLAICDDIAASSMARGLARYFRVKCYNRKVSIET